jgi:hypothetical protein
MKATLVSKGNSSAQICRGELNQEALTKEQMKIIWWMLSSLMPHNGHMDEIIFNLLCNSCIIGKASCPSLHRNNLILGNTFIG